MDSITQIVHEGKKKWRCEICLDMFMIKQSAKQHILSVHQGGEKEVKNHGLLRNNEAPVSGIYKCERCDKIFSKSYFLKHHIRIQECKNQGKKEVFKKVHEEIKNEEEASSTSKQYKCDSCDKSFNNSYIFRLHMKTVHETQKLFNCDFCDLSYRSRPCLIVHRNKVHKNEIKFKPIKITDPKTRENQSYNCELCGKTFSRNVLKQHKCGTATSPPICHLCGSQFKKKRNLDQHIHTVHEGNKDFKCESCGKDFALMGTLNQHKKLVHEGIKEKVCTLCGKQMGTGGQLKAHMDIHLGLRRFQCKFCEKVFRGSSGRKKHMLKSHPTLFTPKPKIQQPLDIVHDL